MTINVFSAVLLEWRYQTLTIILHMCVIMCGCSWRDSYISLSHFATDQSDASSVPSSPLVAFLHTAKLQTLLISLFPSLSPWLSRSHSPNHHQKATEETHSKRSISALLIHSLASRTQSSHDKRLDGNYLCCWGGSGNYPDGVKMHYVAQPVTLPRSTIKEVSLPNFLEKWLHIYFTLTSGCW